MDTNDASRNPYVGPRPFERNEGRFFGRTRETQEIVSLVFGHPVVLVYAHSGAGKTSLFNAAVVPALETEQFEVLPLTRVRGLLPEDINREEITNVYTFNALLNLEPETDPRTLIGKSLAAYLSERPRVEGNQDAPLPRALIFDQFEELFTLYSERGREQQQAFVQQVADALESDPLLRVVFVLREDYLAELDPFAPLLPEALRIRFRLERLGIPAALPAVVDPLEGTGRSFGRGVAEELVEELAKLRVESDSGEAETLSGEFVEPVHLQLVCERLWEKLPETTEVISSDLLLAFGNVNQALQGFYEDAVEEASATGSVREVEVRDWFKTQLITPAGTRGIVFQGATETEGIPNEVVEVLENRHVLRGDLRAGSRWFELTHDRFIEPIEKANRDWLASRWPMEQTRRRLEARAEEWQHLGGGSRRLLDELELREAQRWAENPQAQELGISQSVTYLLDSSGVAIEDAERAHLEAEREKEAARLREVEQANELAEARQRESEQAKELAAEKDRQARAQLRVAKRLGRLSKGLVVVLVLALGTGWYAWRQQQVAETARATAEGALQETKEAKADTEEALSQAKDAKTKAQLALAETEKAKDQIEESELKRTALLFDSQLTHASLLARGEDYAAARSVLAESRALDTQIPLARRHSRDFLAHHVETFGGSAQQVYEGAGAPLYSTAVSPDGRLLAAAGAPAEQLAAWEGPDNVWSLAVSPDGSLLASGGPDNDISLWDAATGELVRRLEGHSNPIAAGTGLAFSPTGEYLASASYDETARLWDVATGESLLELKGHNGEVHSVTFTPDGRHVATGSADRRIVLWAVDSGRPVQVFTGHENFVLDSRLFPDTQRRGRRMPAPMRPCWCQRAWTARCGSGTPIAV